MQTTFTDNFTKGYAGQKVDIGPEDVKSRSAVEAMDFGSVGVDADNSGTQIKLPSADQLILDADFVASNQIDGTVRVYNSDGTSTDSLISVVFNTDHATTMDDLATAIAGVSGVSSASKGGASDRTLTLVPESGVSVALLGDWVITLGASQAGITYGSTQTFGYIALKEEKEQNDAGDVQYNIGDTVNGATKGRVWITCENAFNNTSDVYVRIIEDGANLRGQIRTDSDSGKALLWSDAKINDSGTAGEVALMEINLP